MPILLSETAAKEIKEIIKQQSLPEGETKLRVGVKGGGCSGFSYMLDLTEEAPADTNEQLEAARREDPLRSEELSLSQRRRNRLQRRSHGTRVRVQESQCDQFVRMRIVVLGLNVEGGDW